MTNLYSLYLRHPKVTTDSRDVPQGSIFFAVRGENFDGNRFAADALAKGAAYAVVDRAEVVQGDKYVLVDDALAELGKLAAHHRRELGIPVLGLTGSNGKTTTKELVAAVLSRKFRLAYTPGNLNNNIGVPLTILGIAPGEAEMAVIEMGASAPGEIAYLCPISQPGYGLITNVGPAHLLGFGDLDGVKAGKGELFDYLAEHGGTAFYRSDDPVLAEMVAARAGLRAEGYTAQAADGLRSNLVGEYNRYNIAAAVAVGRYFGVPEKDIAAAIAEYIPANNRSQRTVTAKNTLIVDCYNANPMSMAAALDNIINKEEHPHKTLILGGMRELGAFSAEEHQKVVDRLLASGIDDIYLVGSEFAEAVKGTGLRLFKDNAELYDHLSRNPLSERLILIKGSRGIALEKVIELL